MIDETARRDLSASRPGVTEVGLVSRNASRRQTTSTPNSSVPGVMFIGPDLAPAALKRYRRCAVTTWCSARHRRDSPPPA
jgi:hypothetical protein